jgi:hypothetical protein
MKLVFFIFVLLPSIVFSQTDLNIFTKDTSRHIINGANVVYVKNTDFNKVCNALLDAGFTIDKKDNDLKTADTKEPKNDFWIPVLSVRIKDSLTIIRPKIYDYIFNMLRDGVYTQNNNGNPKSNAYVHAFLQAYKVAKLMGVQ